MRTISYWARANLVKARIAIVLIKLLLWIMAYFVGRTLVELEIILPQLMGIMAAGALVIIAILYPSLPDSKLSKLQFYWYQKSCDLLLGALTFILVVFITTNQLPATGYSSTFATRPVNIRPNQPTAEEILKSLEHRDKKTLTRQEKRILKDEFKKQLKVFAKANVTGDKHKADNAALIILTIVAAVGLLFLLAGLVCSLSCSGADAAALIVGLLGLVGIIWGTVAIINRISKGPKKRKVEPSPAASQQKE